MGMHSLFQEKKRNFLGVGSAKNNTLIYGVLGGECSKKTQNYLRN